MNSPSLFVSTAIPFVNAPPHLGFALEVVLADALARHARARGVDVRFVSGTDDNSLKNVRAAEALGVSTREFVDANGARYRALDGVLGASFDDFVRTSADARHVAAVRALWTACARRGDLEKRTYRGLYCVGCEQYFHPSELDDGLCPEHRTLPETVEEENWFFRLSRYERQISAALESGRLKIEPPARAREIERFVAGGLRDVSVSRSRVRARGWGLEVPGDPDQIVYVWFDALGNYLSSLGWPDDRALFHRFWGREDRRVVHAVGKGITRFHAVLWPAILLAADLPLPSTIWSHGYLTVGGQKIGKSRGNGIDPVALVQRFGTDAVRYFLLRHVGPNADADVDEARVAAAHDAELADSLGNLVSRTLALLKREAGGRLPPPPPRGLDPEGEALLSRAYALDVAVDEAIARFAPDDALRRIFEVVATANKHLAATAPWALAKRAGEEARVVAILFHTASVIGAVAAALGPFLPGTATRIQAALADPSRATPVLFPKARGIKETETHTAGR
jgi:methionyl-tRNA synthetase